MTTIDVIPADAPAFVKTSELARWLGVSNQTLHRQARLGDLPKPTQVSPLNWLWDVEAVRAVLARRREQYGSDDAA